MHYKCYFDASVKDGRAHCGYIIMKGKEIVGKERIAYVAKASSDAEAMALYNLLVYIEKVVPKNSDIAIYGGAKNVISSINSFNTPYQTVKSQYKKAQNRYGNRISISYIHRGNNLHAHTLPRGTYDAWIKSNGKKKNKR